MRYFAIIVLIVFALNEAEAQKATQRSTKIQTNTQLAISYYNAKEYEKAVPLLLEVYSLSRNSYYFRLYLTCLVELKDFEQAEKRIEKEIKKIKTPSPELYVHWGHILKIQKRNEEATQKYNKALKIIPANKSMYLVTANSFLQWGEYEMAEKTYLKGRKTIAPERFNYELARVYLYLRKYDNMMEEYLDMVRQDEKRMSQVQSALSSVMRMDIDNGLRDKFRKQVLKRIQTEPNITGYNRLLIWFFLQEKKFSSALRQSVALDRRTGEESPQIITLGQMALKNKKYADAKNAYEYLLGKGEKNPFYKHAFSSNIHASYMEYISENKTNLKEATKLEKQFEDGLAYLGYNVQWLSIIQEYAHFLAFYQGNTEKAIENLKKGLEIPRLKSSQTGQLKTELADIYVYANDPWEATLIYSQVIDTNKKNALGDEVKLKKAKLAYYMGQFSWAKAQLDVLKASTSKLTANDAMDLSLLIGNNLNLDTTAIPLKMFARADLLFFRNKDDMALASLDSIAEAYPYHTLVDDILYRKSKIEIEQQNYELASQYLEQITTDFSYDLLGDDALFLLAEIYNYHLSKKEKAKNLYKEILTSYPGSVFVDESRKKYRMLREIYPDKESETDKESLFMEGIINSESN